MWGLDIIFCGFAVPPQPHLWGALAADAHVMPRDNLELPVNRPYLSLGIVTTLTAAAARGLSGDPADHVDLAATVEAALRFIVVIVGGVALRALWQGHETARRWTAAWAALVLVIVSAQDVLAGYFRTGLSDRLLVTVLISVVVMTAVWQVPRRLAAE